MLTVVLVPPGGTAREVSPIASSIRYSTAAVGGYGACSFTLHDRDAYLDIPHLATVRVYHGTQLVWEGRVEDKTLRAQGDTVTVDVQCFGWRRLLEETSVRRLWVYRSIPWRLVGDLSGSGKSFNATTWAWSTIGNIDSTDTTKTGVLFSAQTNQAAAANEAHGTIFDSQGIQMLRLILTHRKVGNDPVNTLVQDSPDSTTWTSRYDVAPSNTADTTATVVLGSTARYLRLIGYFASAVTGANVAIQIWNMRILGVTTSEDETGGLYAGTVLRDLVSLIPGLNVGTIEDGSEHTIQQVARYVRDRALSVVEEVASYHTREWAVWEDGRFDWRQPNLDEPQWVLTLQDLVGLEIESSVDGAAKTTYVLYQDASTGTPTEQSATSTDQRNPYVRLGQTKDELLSAPVVLTSAAASRLASVASADAGNGPRIRGRVVVPATRTVQHVTRGPDLALAIRGGDNVVLPELPKTEIMRGGRDNETLFHVTSTDVDLDANTVTLELEGVTRQIDALLARLASLTGTLG